MGQIFSLSMRFYLLMKIRLSDHIHSELMPFSTEIIFLQDL